MAGKCRTRWCCGRRTDCPCDCSDRSVVGVGRPSAVEVSDADADDEAGDT